MSPSRPLLTRIAILSSFEAVAISTDELGEAVIGNGGRSIVPFFTFIIIALAFARIILSSHALTASMSPSRPLLTNSNISFSLSELMTFYVLKDVLLVFVLQALLNLQLMIQA